MGSIMIENYTVIDILMFLTKNNFCAYSFGSGLKFIFHWNGQLVLLAKSLFKMLAILCGLPQRIEMYHLQIILGWMLNHQIRRLCILEKGIVQV